MKKNLDSHLLEVSHRTTDLAGQSVTVKAKGKSIRRLRITVPKVRRLVKAGYSFTSETPSKTLEAWDHIWHHSAYYEVMSQALYFYQHRDLSRKETSTILAWVERCTCWEHSDDLSKIYASVVEANASWVVPRLKRWNRSDNPWKRRQSMVSLIEYASKRKRVLPYAELIAFIEPLLNDEDYYVQKGLGWTLREIGNVYPQQAGRFMERHAARLSPQAWTAATKNLGKSEKDRLKAIRKAGSSST